MSFAKVNSLNDVSISLVKMKQLKRKTRMVTKYTSICYSSYCFNLITKPEICVISSVWDINLQPSASREKLRINFFDPRLLNGNIIHRLLSWNFDNDRISATKQFYTIFVFLRKMIESGRMFAQTFFLENSPVEGLLSESTAFDDARHENARSGEQRSVSCRAQPMAKSSFGQSVQGD